MVMAPNPVMDMNQGRPIQKLQLGAVSRDTAQTIANDGAIVHNGFPRVRVTTAGAVTGVIVDAGLYDGQVLIIQNDSANTLTMAAVATSRVANGVTFVVPALSASWLVWDGSQSKWFGRF